MLGLAQPTVRAWIEAGVLDAVAGVTPVRVEVLSLAAVREHGHDRNLLIAVMRLVRDRAALAGSEEGFADLRAGRVVPLGDDLRDEIDQLRRRERPRSKSG